jgi:hypothetical protein
MASPVPKAGSFRSAGSARSTSSTSTQPTIRAGRRGGEAQEAPSFSPRSQRDSLLLPGFSGFPRAANPKRAELYRHEATRLCRVAEVATLTEVRVNFVRTARLYEGAAMGVRRVLPSLTQSGDRSAPARAEARSRRRGAGCAGVHRGTSGRGYAAPLAFRAAGVHAGQPAARRFPASARLVVCRSAVRGYRS